MKRSYLLFLFIALSAGRSSAQEWVVPPENSSKLSPFAFSDSTRKSGADLYNLNCKSCHGDPGKNNAVKLVPLPPDPASAKLQDNSDGAIFYKVAEGRGTMPSFKNALSAADTWRIISFIRSFNKNYVQEIAKKLASGSTLEQVKLLLTWNKEKNSVLVAVSAMKNQVRQPVAGAEIKLFVKRYFGNQPVGEVRTTDNQGIAMFQIPKKLPGDSTGILRLIARPVDETAFGEAQADTSMAIGVPTYRPPLNEERALWNVVQKTPLWLLFTYVISVLAVWGFIFYVLLMLREIYRSGSVKEPEK
ncbi:MAG TPA: c-type cytochrome [Prolixibacteraceae bacterium]|nr:c-type cytochrome [Prolixibacteraceae bacterium]